MSLTLKTCLRKKVEYRLSEEDQVCSCCGGPLHEMSTEVRRELKVIPAQVKVVEYVNYVYSCRHCERHKMETTNGTADMQVSVYPGSIASPSTMVYIMNQKYVESMPLYRQEKTTSSSWRNVVTIGDDLWCEYMAYTYLKLDV
ncbi:IS66 family transposase zinc-finger binding domain-containing protein [Aquibacillus albus]|uniref:Transposase n=1 Tax=Aquibacillus albus TaxID=1168171 RepID=A0ABS2N4V7_9BACI|nr:IS66 family transposase zinc-finger binding domain-containing protein [Aquibacillus albus]MBM7573185.1 transposase [Aquibacillus albus]